MQAKHLVPNAVTLANISWGFMAVIAAAEGHFERSVLFLFFAALCDLFDGGLARMLKASSKFGLELDSISDAISFGLVPGVLVYLAVLRQLGGLGLAISIGYTVCGALRLARYNVIDTGTLGNITFQGLPIPIAAGYLMSFIMVRGMLPVALVAGGTLFIAGCMVSTLKIPKFRRGGLPMPMLVFGIGLFVVFFLRPSALTWHLWNGWNVILTVTNYIKLGRAGQLGGPAGLRRAA